MSNNTEKIITEAVKLEPGGVYLLRIDEVEIQGTVEPMLARLEAKYGIDISVIWGKKDSVEFLSRKETKCQATTVKNPT